MQDLPAGTVTFLFTDIEGSTALLKQLGRDRYDGVLADHGRLLRAAIAAHDGRVVDTQGDSFFAAFRTAGDAVAAATDAQRELAAHEWGGGVEVKVRMGLHTGEPKVGEARYIAYGKLDADLARNGASWVAIGTTLNNDFFSARTDCQVFQPAYGFMDLGALCIRR